jgi:hypothetical protein
MLVEALESRSITFVNHRAGFIVSCESAREILLAPARFCADIYPVETLRVTLKFERPVSTRNQGANPRAARGDCGKVSARVQAARMVQNPGKVATWWLHELGKEKGLRAFLR